MTSSSEVPGFYKKKPSERLDYVKKFAKLSDEETQAIGGYGALGEETANRMIENVVGTFPLPLGIAANFMDLQMAVLQYKQIGIIVSPLFMSFKFQ